MSRAEDDRTALMVLDLVRQVVRDRKKRIPHNPLESTELWVPPDVEEIVCRRRRSS